MRGIGYLLLGLMMIASVLPMSMAVEPRETPRAIPHTVLGELFTATWCGFCPAADNAFDGFIDNASLYPGRFVALEWHPTSQGDPYGGDDQNATISYYGVGAFPTAIFDGTQKWEGGSTSANDPVLVARYQGMIDARPATSIYTINIECDLINDYVSMVYVNVTASGAPTNTSMKVRAVVAEDLDISHNNGQLRWTARDTVIKSALTISDSETKNFSGNGTIDTTWVITKLSVVASIQSDTTKEVLQAATTTNLRRLNNLAPSATGLLPNYNFDEDTVDTKIDLASVFTDPEQNPMTFGAIGTPHITASIAGSKVTLTPAKDWSGTETVILTAQDQFARTPTTYSVPVKINPVNDAPNVKKGIGDFSMMEGSSKVGVDLDDCFADVDSPSLTFSASGNTHIGVSINPTSHVVTYNAPDLWTGKETITFTASDGALEVSSVVNVTVVHVNHPPVYSQVADISMPENGADTSIDLAKVFSDADGFDTLTFSSENIGGHLTVTIDQALKVTIKPQAYWNGNEVVVLTAADGISNPVNMQVNVTVTPVNFAPEVTGSLEKIVFDEDTAYITDRSLKNCFKDPDGDELTFTAEPSNANLVAEINPDGTVSLTPAKDFAGVVKVVFHAADAGGLEATYTCNVTINNIQDAPVITSNTPASSKTITMNEQETKTFNITAFDADSDTLEYTWSVDSKDKDVNENTFDYTPDYSAAGTHKITAVVSDGKETAEFTWTVKVVNVNRIPTASISSPLNLASYNSGAQIRFTATGTDPDNDKLTYKWYSDGTQIGSLADFSGPLSSGTHTITLEVNDGTDTYTTAGVSITVKKASPAATPGFEGLILVAGILAAVLLYARRK
jgi:hypothetical protein